MEALVFWLAAAAMVAFTLLTISSRSPVYSACFMILSFAATAALFVLLDAWLIAAVEVLVYAGAIMVLFLFVIMLLGVDRDDLLIVADRRTTGLAVAGVGLVLWERERFAVVKAVREFIGDREDVHALVPSLLDPALFNVTALVEQGFDDASFDSLPLIVRHRDGHRSGIPAAEVTRQLESIDSTAVRLDKDRAAELGTAREVVSRLLKEFSARGLVKLERGRIVVESPKVLERM